MKYEHGHSLCFRRFGIAFAASCTTYTESLQVLAPENPASSATLVPVCWPCSPFRISHDVPRLFSNRRKTVSSPAHTLKIHYSYIHYIHALLMHTYTHYYTSSGVLYCFPGGFALLFFVRVRVPFIFVSIH